MATCRCSLHGVLYLVFRQVYAVSHFIYTRFAFKFLFELTHLSVNLVNASHLVLRKAHKSALLGYGLQNALANPPYGVRDELKASGFIKLLCGFDKPHISFVDKIRQTDPVVLVLFGNRHHETEIGFC
ncbi:Uncharacterised protein [Segatella copri]|nr:Uncharacterised protein [Segatella copri]